MFPVHVNTGVCWTAGIDDQHVLGRGLEGGLGGVAEPALLHGQGEVGHGIDVTPHVDLVSRAGLRD